MNVLLKSFGELAFLKVEIKIILPQTEPKPTQNPDEIPLYQHH